MKKYVLVILNIIDHGRKYNYRQVFEIGKNDLIDNLAVLAERTLFKDDDRDHSIASPVHVYECSTSVITKELFDALSKKLAS